MTPGCIFCEPERERVLDDPLVYAIRDGFPVSSGHTLVITKRHVATYFEATAEEQAAIWSAVERVKAQLDDEFQPSGYNVGFNAGAAAGQTVMHLHVHVIPRYEGDMADPRGGVRHVIPSKGNYLASSPMLVTNGLDDTLARRLGADLDQARRVDIAVAFVMRTGVHIIGERLAEVLSREGSRLRLVTGDYQDVTEPEALRQLLDLRERTELVGEFDLRVFETRRARRSFHPKVYLIQGPEGLITYVGSSNLSQSALKDGVEWNLRARGPEPGDEARAAFEALFSNEATVQLTHEWVQDYEANRKPPEKGGRVLEVAPPEEPHEPVPEPREIQREALAALSQTRKDGNEAGLVVLATGLGKTWLSAFDSVGFERVLFVAHREEILDQALKTFRKIRPGARLGYYKGDEKVTDADVLFASIQTLGKKAHLRRFGHEHFDYIVVDEFHHASARTYRQLIQYFSPRFLLGLTATPDRSDGANLLALCQENLVYECGLVRGVERAELCPFHYHGIPDGTDYANIPWRSRRFDMDVLETAVQTQERAQNALEQFRKHKQTRALGFCVSRRHADFMKKCFVDAGVRAASVHSGPTSDPRTGSLERLRNGELDILFCVDMFNEGVDVPAIDTVLMLRPTESRILWLQQLGRGLRKFDAKSHLQVIDYIGNHQTFLNAVSALLNVPLDDHEEIRTALLKVKRGEFELPPGCEITYELESIDILTGLLRKPKHGEVVTSWYRDFRDRNGARPTATDAYHAGLNPGATSVRRRYGSWFNFVDEMGDLTEAEQRAKEGAHEFLVELEKTPMTKSYEMVVLAAMLEEEDLPSELSVDALTKAVARVAGRSRVTRGDFSVELSDLVALRTLLVEHPLSRWAKRTDREDRPYFELDAETFRTGEPLNVGDAASELAPLIDELVTWRLARYLDGKTREAEASGAVLKLFPVGKKPGIKLDRKKYPDLPRGWVDVDADGQKYQLNFVKEAVEIAQQDGSPANVLGTILRKWFGPNAGMPGTQHSIACERTEEGYRISPVGGRPKRLGAELWASYAREQIPGLFGMPWNKSVWQTGFVFNPEAREKHVMFLLVTLDKAAKREEHKYADRFLDAKRIQWQTQNRTSKASASGKAMRHHRSQGVGVHLFVREGQKTDDGRAAPFVYCGQVDFVAWAGDKPITLEWQLREAVPERLWGMLGIEE